MKKKTFAVLIASALATPLSFAADFERFEPGRRSGYEIHWWRD